MFTHIYVRTEGIHDLWLLHLQNHLFNTPTAGANVVDHVWIIVPMPKQRPEEEGEESKQEKRGEEEGRGRKEREKVEDSAM